MKAIIGHCYFTEPRGTVAIVLDFDSGRIGAMKYRATIGICSDLEHEPESLEHIQLHGAKFPAGIAHSLIEKWGTITLQIPFKNFPT
jgi:hypothetical protein